MPGLPTRTRLEFPDAETRALFGRHGLRSFEDIMNCSFGEHVTRKRGRTVVRLPLGDRAFFLKRNRLHGVEFLKQLKRFRLPARGAREEWESIQAVADAGIPTVRPIAMGERTLLGLELCSFTVTEELYRTRPLDKVLMERLSGLASPGNSAWRREILTKLAAIARTLHGHGMNHQDFYLSHFYLGEDGTLYLIDLQRVMQRRRVPRHYVIKDLAQLSYSADTTGVVRTADQVRFYRLYRGIPALEPGDRRILKRVRRKARWIAEHTVKLLARRRRRREIP